VEELYVEGGWRRTEERKERGGDAEKMRWCPMAAVIRK
jgi:hypothetical protein